MGFTVFPDPDLTAGEEHGFWFFDTPSTILASSTTRTADSQWNS